MAAKMSDSAESQEERAEGWWRCSEECLEPRPQPWDGFYRHENCQPKPHEITPLHIQYEGEQTAGQVVGAATRATPPETIKSAEVVAKAANKSPTHAPKVATKTATFTSAANTMSAARNGSKTTRTTTTDIRRRPRLTPTATGTGAPSGFNRGDAKPEPEPEVATESPEPPAALVNQPTPVEHLQAIRPVTVEPPTSTTRGPVSAGTAKICVRVKGRGRRMKREEIGRGRGRGWIQEEARPGRRQVPEAAGGESQGEGPGREADQEEARPGHRQDPEAAGGESQNEGPGREAGQEDGAAWGAAPRACFLQPRMEGAPYFGPDQRIYPLTEEFQEGLWATQSRGRAAASIEREADRIMKLVEERRHREDCKLTLTTRAVIVTALQMKTWNGRPPTIHDILLKECLFCGHQGDIRLNHSKGHYQLQKHDSFTCHHRCCNGKVDRSTLQMCYDTPGEKPSECGCGTMVLQMVTIEIPNQDNIGWRWDLYQLKRDHAFAMRVKTGRVSSLLTRMRRAMPAFVIYVVTSKGQDHYERLLLQSDEDIINFLEEIIGQLNQEHAYGGPWNRLLEPGEARK
jgi:hypothetical protein